MGEAKKPPPKQRPWLKKKPAETNRQYHQRTNHTCYACGVEMADLSALDAHEATHR